MSQLGSQCLFSFNLSPKLPFRNEYRVSVTSGPLHSRHIWLTFT